MEAMACAKYRHVIQYAETALRGAQGRLSPALVTDLHALQAKAYARMGDQGSRHAYLRRSESHAVRIRHEAEPPETGYVQPGLLQCQQAEALRRLGDLAAARKCAEEALLAAEECHLRGQANRPATLALILAQRGEVDEAIAVGERMPDRAEGMESTRITDRVDTVAGALRGYDSTAVRDFLAKVEHGRRVSECSAVYRRVP